MEQPTRGYEQIGDINFPTVMEQPSPTEGKHVQTRKSSGMRAQCANCGSPNVHGIVDAYCDGPITVDATGRLQVLDGTFELHIEHDISPSSIQCHDCGGSEVAICR